jgi:hypothetical protein
MKKVKMILASFVALICVQGFAQTTWYVRPDGGTRYSQMSPMVSAMARGINPMRRLGHRQ